VILVAAMVLLFIVAAIAALAIDLVTFYAARSQAQMAADSAALAGARVLANSGMTSNPSDLGMSTQAQTFAQNTANQVALTNSVGGRPLTAGEVTATVTVNSVGSNTCPPQNPCVTVRVSRADLPTFFAKIWGRNTAAVTASATAEVYNPSGLSTAGSPAAQVAPLCVKPWILPNMHPVSGAPIFDKDTGAIMDSTLLGWIDPGSGAPPVYRFYRSCGSCTGALPAPTPWRFYPAANSKLPAPTQGFADCDIAINNNYLRSIAGCVQTPISCNSDLDIDTATHPNRSYETAHAVNCLSNAVNNKGDRVDVGPPGQPFQFIAGDDNPIVSARNHDVMVSDSLVTVPVYDSSVPISSTVRVIGFVQLFVNSDGTATPANFGNPNFGRVRTAVVNMIGCGRNATGAPIVGNGASAVPVRLITPP